MTREPTTTEDDDIIFKASRSDHNGKRFSDLYAGKWQEYYDSQSEADMALCCHLAFWCNRDPVQMNRIFCSSGLFRDKWLRDDYRYNTINAANNYCKLSLDEYRKEKRNQEVLTYEQTFN